ncbi:MAG TPA: hypothetical protein VIK14_00520 [Ignavibacteria bacterium]
MKKAYFLFLVLFTFLLSGKIYSQGYFVAFAGDYVNSSNFNTNIQNDLSKYTGIFIAVSEIYESNYLFKLTERG